MFRLLNGTEPGGPQVPAQGSGWQVVVPPTFFLGVTCHTHPGIKAPCPAPTSPPAHSLQPGPHCPCCVPSPRGQPLKEI